MKMKHCRPRCAAITEKGNPCQMTVAGPGRDRCRYHDPDLASATHERNRVATRRYWERWRTAKAIAATAEAPGDS